MSGVVYLGLGFDGKIVMAAFTHGRDGQRIRSEKQAMHAATSNRHVSEVRTLTPEQYFAMRDQLGWSDVYAKKEAA